MKRLTSKYLENFKVKKVQILVLFFILTLIIARQNAKVFLYEKDLSLPRGTVTVDKIKEVFPKASKIQVSEGYSSRYIVFDKNDEKLGDVIDTSLYTEEIKGYGGQVPFIIGVDNSGKVKGLSLLTHYETQSFVDRVKEEGLLDSWNGMSLKEASEHKVDAVTGATVTSNAIIRSFRETVSGFSGSTKFIEEKEVKTVFLLFVLIFALASFLKPQIFNRVRTILLFLSILVLGFWAAKFLSIALFMNWIKGVGGYFLIGIFLLTVILGLFTNKNLYCTYLCPYGALQELAGKVNRKKIIMAENICKNFKITGRIFLLVLTAVALVGIKFDFSYIEPFAAFLFRSAHLVVLVLAIVFLLMSFFQERFWCKFFCPTGQIISIFTKKWKFLG